jgi:hypothetical protein
MGLFVLINRGHAIEKPILFTGCEQILSLQLCRRFFPTTWIGSDFGFRISLKKLLMEPTALEVVCTIRNIALCHRLHPSFFHDQPRPRRGKSFRPSDFRLRRPVHSGRPNCSRC